MSLNQFVIESLVQEVCNLHTVEGLRNLGDLASGIETLVAVKNDRNLDILRELFDVFPVLEILTRSDKKVCDMRNRKKLYKLRLGLDPVERNL